MDQFNSIKIGIVKQVAPIVLLFGCASSNVGLEGAFLISGALNIVIGSARG